MPNVPAIRLGIIGTGIMGGYHARVAAMLAGCDLIGIYDESATRADDVALQYGTTAYPSLEKLCADAEAVIIATPTITHAEMAMTCLQAGCHVLLEKPIAATVEEGEALVAASQRTDRILMIGHVERYNPAVTTMLSLVNSQELFSCEVQRLSSSPGRDQSVDIIFDLMIHDLDLVLAFTQSTPIAYSAMGHCVRGELIDHATALVQFANGATAMLIASAVCQKRVRQARLLTPNEQYTVDFASREVRIHREGQSSIAKESGQYFLANKEENIIVQGKEPLAAEQEHFLRCIRTGERPLTSPEAGLQALKMAYTIQECVNQQLLTYAL